MRFTIRKKRIKREIDPDEIFLDSKNLPNFNTQQFEGRIEKPIPKKSIIFLGLFFCLIILIFISKLGFLQIIKGSVYLEKSENNTLVKEPIVAFRGLIKDKNGEILAWNTWDEKDVNKFSIPERTYTNLPGFSLLLGYTSSPKKDSSGYYWQETFIGKDGVEKFYNDILTGENGVKITETDVNGNIQSENIVSSSTPGDDLVLSIDSKIQNKLYESIANMAESSNFIGGAGVIMDINSGEIVAITSYPEYNSNILSKGENTEIINNYFLDKRKVFLNRAVSGLYTPGSIVKPFIGYAALKEEIISPLKNILSSGSISVPNPYNPSLKTIFKDHGSFGYVDIKKAISVSSDVYFYEVGGGFNDQKGLGITQIDNYVKMFGISKLTGVDILGENEGIIPTPEWKSKIFNGDIWRVGDTYNTSIGQYGFQVTPIQMVRAVSALANMGTLVTPHILLNDTKYDSVKSEIDIDEDKMEYIHEGMRMAVTEGTCTALNTSSVEVAAKSGTAQVGYGNTNTNSWIIGFFPYKNPRYAFAIIMERGPKTASGNATRVMREVIDYMSISSPEYLE